MLKTYFKFAFRNLLKNKSFSLINILGFAFGMSICLGIYAYLLHEYSYNTYHKNAHRIYRLNDAQNKTSTIDYRVKDILLSNYPEINNACLALLINHPMPVTVNNKGVYLDNILSADNAFFDIFSVPFIHGNRDNPLPDLHSAVLTTSAAKKLFGVENPVGQELELRHRFPLTVSGVIEDFPDNSSIQAQMIVNAENENFKFYFSCENGSDQSTYRWLLEIFLLMNEQADPQTLVDKINSHADLLAPYEESVGLTALTDIYLHDTIREGAMKRGNPGLLKLLLTIGLVILILAVINYINLTAAQQHRRFKEIGVKKSIGAGKKDILVQFLTESVVVSFIAFGAALLLLWHSIPIYRSIFFDDYSIVPLLHYWPAILISVFAVGIFSGLGSVFLFSSINPIQALKGEFKAKRTGFTWRNGLTIFQFIVSIALIFCIIVMQKQIRYVKYTNPGFNEEQLLKLDVPQIQQTDKNAALLLIDKFRSYPTIQNVCMTNGVPGTISTFMGMGTAEKRRNLPIIFADYNFLQTFGLEIIMGRIPEPSDFGTTCLMNEAAYKYYEWTNLENKRFDNGRPGGFDIVGIVNNFHFQSLRSSIEPLCILFPGDVYPTHLSIRISAGHISDTMQFIQKTWHEILPQYPLQYEFYDSWLDAMYREDEKLGTAIGLFASLAIVISCLGILGMAIFSTQKRTKEIGIRKVVGASVPEILFMLGTNFSKWVLLANIFAWPLAWYAMNTWLQNFAYRIDLTIWPFLLAGVLALLIALLTVSWQAIRAATANPVEALRYE
ncbi:ABC transporter permease [candidate division KSB1 bacterium]|nr:ABC transporter permease [candidate division KSB1 bacterium]